MVNIETIKNNVINLSKSLGGLNIDSIFLEQKGKLDIVFYNSDCLHELRSCSKILVAMAIGIAIDKGMLNLETRVYPVLKNIVNIENKDNISKIKQWSIGNLLTHTTGYEKQMMSKEYIRNIDDEQLLDYALNYDIPYEVGKRFAYNNAEPFILSVFFQEKFGVNLSDFINENIFSKLNITDYKWNNFCKYCPGSTGLFLKHSDFHKIGKLLLNNGIYDGTQIISKNWIKEMCSLHLETPELYKKDKVLPKFGVGYFTFISKNNYVFRDGSNGQYIIVNKKNNLLITIMSSEKEMKNVIEILRNVI